MNKYLLQLRGTFALLILFTLAYELSFAQPPHFNIPFSATYQSEKLSEVLTDIESKTDFIFSYSSGRIPSDAEVSGTFDDELLPDVLDQLFDGLPIRFEYIDEYIILKKGEIHHAKKEGEVTAKFTFHGFIRDSKTGESLIGATLYIPEKSLGAITNAYGYFSLTLPRGKYRIDFAYIGYNNYSLEIEFGRDMKFDIELTPSVNLMKEVIISSIKKDDLAFKKVSSQSEVLPEQVKKLPALFGESDVLKNLELQAGINYYGDASSYFHVRGGHYDQNLILLDEATLYNPSHLLGLFSPIIPDAVKSVDIFKAGFPAEYGGRLSSVIDIRTRDGNLNKFSGSGAVGIISGRLALEGPFKKGKSSYFIAFRRSYFDVMLKALSPVLENLYFYDLTGKLNLRLGPRDRLYITLYRGSDVFRLKEESNRLVGLDWINNSTTVRWNHILGSKTFMNLTVFGSRYDYYLRNDATLGSYWNSQISNLSFKEEITYIPTPRFLLKFGTRLGAYAFNPGNYTIPGNRKEVQVSPANSIEGAIFAGIEQEIFPWLAAQYGLRYAVWTDMGESFVARYDENYEYQGMDYYLRNQKYFVHTGLEPRISLSARIAKATFLKMSYSRTEQFINLINNSLSPFSSFEVWLPAGPNIKPQMADIYDIGLVKRFEEKGWSMQASIFWKELANQIAYSNHANMIFNPLVEGELRQGDGQAYGLELSLQKESERLNAQLAYSYLRSFLQIEGINNGERYPAVQDRPHTINLSFGYQVKPRWLLTGSLNFASGSRITTPTSFYYYRGYQLPAYSGMNNDRLPPYSRIDLALTMQLNKKPDLFNHSITFAIYNMFGSENPFFLNYNKIVSEQGGLLVPADRFNPEQLTSSVRYTFVMMPSVTYQFDF